MKRDCYGNVLIVQRMPHTDSFMSCCCEYLYAHNTRAQRLKLRRAAMALFRQLVFGKNPNSLILSHPTIKRWLKLHTTPQMTNDDIVSNLQRFIYTNSQPNRLTCVETMARLISQLTNVTLHINDSEYLTNQGKCRWHVYIRRHRLSFCLYLPQPHPDMTQPAQFELRKTCNQTCTTVRVFKAPRIAGNTVHWCKIYKDDVRENIIYTLYPHCAREFTFPTIERHHLYVVRLKNQPQY